MEHYTKVVQSIYEEDYTNFCDYFVDQGGDLGADMNNVNSLVAYHCELYNERLKSLDNMDVQLDCLEEVMSSQIGLSREIDHDSDKHSESEDDGDKDI